VAAAARRFFDKTVTSWISGRWRLIAGIAQAPSRSRPILHLERRRRRRDQVLAAMAWPAHITRGEATKWRTSRWCCARRPTSSASARPTSPSTCAATWRKRYGDKMLYEGGLEVETTLVPWIDASAQENVDFSLRKLDKRQGWRGPLAHLEGAAADDFRRRAVERYGSEAPVEGRLYLGIVESVPKTKKEAARVRVGKKLYWLPPEGMDWAFPFSLRDSTNAKELESVVGVLRKGDVVWVSTLHRSKLRRFSDWTYDHKNEVVWMAAYDNKKPPAVLQLQLEQTPRAQGLIYSYDHRTGYVVAMVGGLDHDRSEFNRVVQACRQPGSTYKPIYYSLALENGYGYPSLLNDIPRAEVDPITGEVWTPTNLNNTVEYQVTLEYALVWSKNVPSVQLFKLVGGRAVENWARKLGFTTQIIPDQALALGASCTRPDELTRSFSAFARNGSLQDAIYVRRVRDSRGPRPRGPQRRRRSDGAARPAARSHGGGGRARVARRDLVAHRVPDLAALAPRGHQGPRARAAQHRAAGRRQDRHLRAPPWTSGSSATRRAG
jgi:penicillin-binding protein 1A